MQAVTVAEVADELYALTPAEFTAARDERARQFIAAGQRAEAAAIKKLARPTAGAWLVNRLARAVPDQMSALFELGEALQEAQRTLAGDRLRDLSVQRRQAINDLLPVATELAGQAGQPASAAILGEVRATLEAATADADAREAVRSGRLAKALAYAGLGEVDLTAALALPLEPRPAKGQSQGRTGAAGARPARQAGSGKTVRVAEALEAAEAAVAEAEDVLASADMQLAGVDEQRQFLRRRISHLERELDQAKAEDARLAREGKQAQRGRDTAARDLESARRRAAQARQRASGSGQGPGSGSS